MQTYQQTLNGLSRIGISGKYFRLLSTVNPVDVSFYRGASKVDVALQMEAGFWAEFDSTFDAVEITTGAAESVKFIVGNTRAGYDRMAGTVSVSNMPASQIVATAAGVALQVEQRGALFTSSFASNAASVANTPVQLIAPAQNVNGIDIYSCEVMDAFNAGGSTFAVLAKAAAPVSLYDGDILLTPNMGMAFYNTWWGLFASLQVPLRIAAGKGVYYFPNAASYTGMVGVSRSITYEVL